MLDFKRCVSIPIPVTGLRAFDIVRCALRVATLAELRQLHELGRERRPIEAVCAVQRAFDSTARSDWLDSSRSTLECAVGA